MNNNRRITAGEKMCICTWHSVFIQYSHYRHDSRVFSVVFCSTKAGCERGFSLSQRPWRAC